MSQANKCAASGGGSCWWGSGLELSRADFYEKELTFRSPALTDRGSMTRLTKAGQSCSGLCALDGTRNFEAVLDLMASEAGRCANDHTPLSD